MTVYLFSQGYSMQAQVEPIIVAVFTNH